jgi:hypothetical protein
MSYPTGGDAATLDNIEYHFINFFGAIIMHQCCPVKKLQYNYLENLTKGANFFLTKP